jgi:hypothetical protein
LCIAVRISRAGKCQGVLCASPGLLMRGSTGFAFDVSFVRQHNGDDTIGKRIQDSYAVGANAGLACVHEPRHLRARPRRENVVHQINSTTTTPSMILPTPDLGALRGAACS